MIVEYIDAAMEKARFEKIADRNPFYAEIPGLKGVWAAGKTEADCRRQLAEALEGWIIVRLRKGLAIPKVSGVSLTAASRMPVHA
ncbi:MAG: type II toxin-antitoxin system HicB family antitoxin [Elusimicrobia bacterium]|nr:type II toxin-antitoxin system HicB family antitoxin [Elusimicrobiota bacterium]